MRPMTTNAAQDGPEDYTDVDFGMHAPSGNVALAAVCAAVDAVLAAGLGREVALLTLRGGLFTLERSGLSEWSDTVVRESIAYLLTPACETAGVAPFTDAEIDGVCQAFAERALDAMGRGWSKGYAEGREQQAAEDAEAGGNVGH